MPNPSLTWPICQGNIYPWLLLSFLLPGLSNPGHFLRHSCTVHPPPPACLQSTIYKPAHKFGLRDLWRRSSRSPRKVLLQDFCRDDSTCPRPHPTGEHTHFAISSISTKLCTGFGFALFFNAQGTIS